MAKTRVAEGMSANELLTMAAAKVAAEQQLGVFYDFEVSDEE